MENEIRLEQFTENNFNALISWVDSEKGLIQFAGAVYYDEALSGNLIAIAAEYAALSYIKEHPEIYVQLEKSSMYLENGFKENLKAIGKNYAMNRVGSMVYVLYSRASY